MTAAVLADGLVFNHGPAAQYLTGMWRPTVTPDAKTTHVRQLIDNALLTHSSQADRFAQQVQSGNRVQILRALEWLAGITRAAMNAAYGTAATDQAITQAKEMINKAASSRAAPSSGVADPQLIPVYFFVAIAVAVAAVVVEVAFATPLNSPDGLAAEQFVNLVANRLHAA